jgi:hypothetical protein
MKQFINFQTRSVPTGGSVCVHYTRMFYDYVINYVKAFIAWNLLTTGIIVHCQSLKIREFFKRKNPKYNTMSVGVYAYCMWSNKLLSQGLFTYSNGKFSRA